MNKKKKDRENLGVELYGVQQELARHQMVLEKNHDDHAACKQDRSQTEQRLNDVRRMYRERQTGVNSERKKGSYFCSFTLNDTATIITYYSVSSAAATVPVTVELNS